MSGNTTIITLFSICRSNLTLVMTPALSTISANAIILIVLRDGWVASEISAMLLVIRVAVASLKIVNSFNRLRRSVLVLNFFCCFCASIFMCIATLRASVGETVFFNNSLLV